MKTKEAFIDYLELFDKEYTVNDSEVLVKTTTPVGVFVKFQEGHYSIEGRLYRWNFLSRLLKMSLNKAYAYLTFLVVLVLVGSVCLSVFISKNTFFIDTQTLIIELGILLIILIWTSLTFIYYYLVFLDKKRQILLWVEKE